MLTKTEAIVLHAFKYGETRMIVDMFTRVYGRLSFVVPLPKSPKGRIKKQFFQPMTLLTIEVDVRPRQQLQKLSHAAITLPLPSLQTHPSKLSNTLFLADFLCRGNFSFHKLLANLLFDVAYLVFLADVDNADAGSFLAGTARTA